MSLPVEEEIVLEPGGSVRRYWRDLWNYRELLAFFAWRDVMVRYKQTALGVAWAVIRPVITAIVFTIVFGRLAKLPSEGVPYPVMVLSGVVAWQFFAAALEGCSGSLVSNSNLIRKVYFPRLLAPVSALAVAMVDFLISFAILIAVMLWFGMVPGWQIIFLPLFLAVAMAAAFGIGIWFATLNVRYRDFRFVVPFMLQFGLYLSPVGFSSAIIPERFQLLYSLNPMVGVIDGFRWALLGLDGSLHPSSWIASLGCIAVVGISGIWYFRRMESSFADVV